MTFPLQIKKSTNRWSCKVCGDKQSLKQVFFKGTSKECRQRVQELNHRRGTVSVEHSISKLNERERLQTWHNDDLPLTGELSGAVTVESDQGESKWNVFVEKSNDDINDGIVFYFNN